MPVTLYGVTRRNIPRGVSDVKFSNKSQFPSIIISNFSYSPNIYLRCFHWKIMTSDKAEMCRSTPGPDLNFSNSVSCNFRLGGSWMSLHSQNLEIPFMFGLIDAQKGNSPLCVWTARMSQSNSSFLNLCPIKNFLLYGFFFATGFET